jgi:hypothetical protein
MSRKRTATVVDLQLARDRRRLHDYEARIQAALEQNRGALSRLFASGALFTRRGTRTGRDLLLAHQHLLRVEALLGKLEDLGEAASGDEVDLIYRELDQLLEKTSQLTERTAPKTEAHRE